MKQYATRFLKTVALGYMAFPAMYMVVAALLFDIPARDIIAVLLSPFYYLLSLIAMAVGYGFWEMRRWAWHLFIFANLLIVYASAVLVADRGTTHNKWFAFLVVFGSIFVLSLRVTRELRVPYFLPSIRWWESNPRYRLSIPVKIMRSAPEQELDGEIVDLSSQGGFVKIRQDFKADEVIRLRFVAFGLEFALQGTVVWRPLSSVTHPKGLGIKFGAMPRPTKRDLRAVEQRLRKISNFYRSSRYLMSPEEFSRRMGELNGVQLTKRQS